MKVVSLRHKLEIYVPHKYKVENKVVDVPDSLLSSIFEFIENEFVKASIYGFSISSVDGYYHGNIMKTSIVYCYTDSLDTINISSIANYIFDKLACESILITKDGMAELWMLKQY